MEDSSTVAQVRGCGAGALCMSNTVSVSALLLVAKPGIYFLPHHSVNADVRI